MDDDLISLDCHRNAGDRYCHAGVRGPRDVQRSPGVGDGGLSKQYSRAARLVLFIQRMCSECSRGVRRDYSVIYVLRWYYVRSSDWFCGWAVWPIAPETSAAVAGTSASTRNGLNQLTVTRQSPLYESARAALGLRSTIRFAITLYLPLYLV